MIRGILEWLCMNTAHHALTSTRLADLTSETFVQPHRFGDQI
jgi:hypothetical protein